MSGLTLTLFGPPYLARDGQPLRLRSRKCLALLTYLTVTDASHSRAGLEALLWPESGAARAHNVLRTTLSLLRRALEGAWLVADRATIGLDGSHRPAVDVVRFRNLTARCRVHRHPAGEECRECRPRLAEAVELYGGDFMAGFTLRDSPQFDDWQALETEALREELSGALERLVVGCSAQGDVQSAIAYARRWVSLDPLHEQAHRALMRLYAGSGQQTAALRQYEIIEGVLEEELGVPPSQETADLYQAIREARVPQPQVTVPLPSLVPVAPRHNLPPQPTPFVGREEELAQIAQLLADPSCRLLTVVGPGGMGKTRLAIQAAADQVQRFAHGVYFIPLASLGSADLMASTIVEILDVSRYGGTDPRVQLLNYLRERQLLLILDNFEHLLEGAALVAQMLEQAPWLKLLATSRERLNLREEWLLELWGMESPDDEEVAQVGEAPISEASLSALEGYSAVELFVQSARRVQSDFSLAKAGVSSVARICQLVEGMPLAIELAAPWIRVMDCEAIAQEIEGGLSFLATILRDVPERHRSMRAVFDHSWKLLSPEEREVLRQLSVFRGGFRREAAEAVAMRVPQSPASLPLLSALVDKSWLRTSPSGRYEMHELMRQYSAERLQAEQVWAEYPEEDHEDTDGLRDRHSCYYGAFLQEREPRLRGPEQGEAFGKILEDMGNVWAAWSWAVERGDVETVSRCVGTLAYAGEVRRWYPEAVQAFEDAAAMLRQQLGLPAHGPGNPRRGQIALVLADILSTQALLSSFLGERAVKLCRESLALLQEVEPGSHRNRVRFDVQTTLGWCLQRRGDSAQVQQLLREALTLAQEIGDAWHRQVALFWLGVHARNTGRYTDAEVFHRQAIAIADETGEQWMRACSLNNLSWVLWAQGEYRRAESLAEVSLQIFQELNDPGGMGHGSVRLGEIATALGNCEPAGQHFQRSLAIADEISDANIQMETLHGQGALSLALGQYAEAKQHFAESGAIAREMGDAYSTDALAGLGHAALALGEVRQAGEYLRQALEGAMKAERLHVAMDALVGLASLLVQAGDPQQAAEILALVLHHLATTQVTRDRARELLAELESELSPEVLGVATTRGQANDLKEIAAAILKVRENGRSPAT